MSPAIPVQEIFSNQVIRKLRKAGITTLLQLLSCFPKDHLTYQNTPFLSINAEGLYRLDGRLVEYRIDTAKGRITIERWVFQQGAVKIKASRLHFQTLKLSQKWRYEQYSRYPIGAVVQVIGKVRIDPEWGKQVEEAQVKVIQQNAISDVIEPVYASINGVEGEFIKEQVRTFLDWCNYNQFDLQLLMPEPDLLDTNFRRSHVLVYRHMAIRYIHTPSSWEHVEKARRRLAFDEMLNQQLLLAHQKQMRQLRVQPDKLIAHARSTDALQQLKGVLPFTLTIAQSLVIDEILQDLSQPVLMKRLVQGDVGSGKTVVAVAALLAVAQSGQQAALMAPLEGLVKQHFNKISKWLRTVGIEVEMLTSSTPPKQAQAVKARLESGALKVVVGTHSLLSESINFRQLGLVVVDEEHRFGVNQRQLLASRDACHELYLSATPIPRSLALTLYGDTEVSTIQSPPSGRKAIKTERLFELEEAIAPIRAQLALGHQAYLIFPLVEESDESELRSIQSEINELERAFAPYQVGTLHGKLKSREKESILKQFESNQIQVLAATTIVEVGIDVANATVIAIIHAERFGLAQLHQLRGRVGRSNLQSYCYLVSNTPSDKANKRLRILERTQDGFKIAEADMLERGEGDLTGTLQSGRISFTIADLSDPTHQQLLELARSVVMG